MKPWIRRLLKRASKRHVEHFAYMHPEDVQVGDRVMLLLEVKSVLPAVPGGIRKHIKAVPASDSRWQAGDQYLWTWGWSMKDEGPSIIVRRVGTGT